MTAISVPGDPIVLRQMHEQEYEWVYDARRF
jgi:hypothetical protein